MCRVLITLISRILEEILNVRQWQILLPFAAIMLEQPIRGGRSYNLTSTIKKGVHDDFFPQLVNGQIRKLA